MRDVTTVKIIIFSCMDRSNSVINRQMIFKYKFYCSIPVQGFKTFRKLSIIAGSVKHEQKTDQDIINFKLQKNY